nr:leucine-rich repeat-containing protein 15-like [Leptinotarsa decemlineata]
MGNRKVMVIFLTIKLFDWCEAWCDEKSETKTTFVPGHHDLITGEYWSDEYRSTNFITINCRGQPPFVRQEHSDRYSGYSGHLEVSTLTISHTHISVLTSTAFSHFERLTILIMNDLQLKELKPGAFNSLHSLKELYLHENQLTVIGSGILNSLSNLEVLDMSKNKIKKLSNKSFIGMTKLKKLFLSSNQLSYFESTILDQNTMIHVDLSYNILSDIEINEVTRIEHLDISNNLIKKLTFCPLDFISFNISRNNIEFLENMNCSANFTLIRFDASYNKISKLDPKFFSNLDNMQYLNLQYNNISSVPTGLFSDLRSLIGLNLSNNQIEQFQHGTFENLDNLQVLDISHNKLKSLRRCLHSLVKLKTLYIQDNEIAYFSREKLSEDLPKSSFISLDGNIFSCDELVNVIHDFREKGISVEYGKAKDTPNIHGISCSDYENLEISAFDDNSVFENIVLSKLQQLGGGDLKNSVLNDYFNTEFKNSNFYKYLENFHEANLFRKNRTAAIFDYFNNDFENSKFYKYLESLQDNENFTIEFNRSVFKYFDNDFKNSNFVKYLNDLRKSDDGIKDSFFNSDIFKYFNGDFKKSNFYKYLENFKILNNHFATNLDREAQKLSGVSDEENNRGIFITIVLLLVVLVSLKIISMLTDFIRKRQEKHESVELIEA